MKYWFSLLFLPICACATKTGGNSIAGSTGAPVVTQVLASKPLETESKTRSSVVFVGGAPLDNQDRSILNQTSPLTVEKMDQGYPLNVTDVIKLSQAGISDDIILKYMQESSSVYSLSKAQVRRLQNTGVSPRVIEFMLNQSE